MKKNIMIAEDDKSIRLLLDMRFKKENMQTALFADAEDAYAYLQTDKPKPDVILTDVMMPKMNGYQFCRNLKSDAKLKKIPVVMLTAKKEVSSKLTGFTLGADEYIYKPFNLTNVVETVKKLLEKSDAPPAKIKYGQNNTVLFKIPNNIDGLGKIREIILELTERYSLTPTAVEHIESMFSELSDLFLNVETDRLFFFKFAYSAQTAGKILMKIEFDEIEIFKKIGGAVENIISKYSKKYLKNESGYLFELFFESLNNIISEINSELTRTVSDVTDNIRNLKTIKDLWNN